MTEEKIKEKARELVSKRARGTPYAMDYYANILVEFTTEVTKGLQEEIEQLKAVADYQTDLGDKYAEENKQLREKVEGYERTRDRLIEMGFPTLKSCREYAEQIEKIQQDLKHKKIAIQNRKARIKELEKKVADLEWQLQEVAKDNDNYQKRNKRLEEEIEIMTKFCGACKKMHQDQIEKMKCCFNCKYQLCDESGNFCGYNGVSGVSGDCDKWELAE